MNNPKNQKFVYSSNGVEFTIYVIQKQTKAGRKPYWVLEDYTTGKRRLLNNKTEKAARQRADEIRAAMVKGQADRMALSHGEWQDVCVAREILRSTCTGNSLTSAIRDWSDCTVMLGARVSLLDAVKFFLSHYRNGGPPHQPTCFKDAAERYHFFKTKSGKSESHCKNIKSRLDRLVANLPANVRVDELTAGQLDGVIVEFGVKEKTRNEYRMVLSNLYTWAAKQNPPLVPKAFNPAKEMERFKVKHLEVEFLRVADLRKIVTSASIKHPELLPLIALVCFGGLRPSEAVRLDWTEVGTDYIRLPGKKSKTGYSRQIPLQPNLKSWLALWRKEAGPICPYGDLSHLNVAIRRCSGVQLSHDAMRHGYGTHRHQILKNLGSLADEMGNSPAICRRHYLNAFCFQEEAEAWFSIVPGAPTNVVPLPDSLPKNKTEVSGNIVFVAETHASSAGGTKN